MLNSSDYAKNYASTIGKSLLRVPLYNTASVDLARLARLGEWITLSNYMLGNKGFFAHIAELTENSKSRLIVTGPVMPM